MLAYVIKRLWQMVPTLFGVVLLVLSLIHISEPTRLM
jgi:ABC-type microcin C transport system permease subunit YejB